jgi:hypothetical protein
MAVQIDAKVVQGVVMLSVRYDRSFFLEKDAGKRLGADLVERRRQVRGEKATEVRSPSCVVEIHADVAGSALVRALIDLWRAVVQDEGRVVCVGYPEDYLHSLRSLIGYPYPRRFSVVRTREEALQELARPEPVPS